MPSPASAQRMPAADGLRGVLRGALRAVARRWPIGLGALGAIVFAVPVALLAHGTARARACVASYTAPRGPQLPDCREEVRWFVTPSRVPWTSTPARYRAEELYMRAAVAAYEDAAVGRPDTAARSRAADDLTLAAGVIRAGSQRLSLEELGRAVGAPDAGRSALLAGDRLTLLHGADGWEHWSARLRTLEAALLEGDRGRAGALAKRYADFYPFDDDLRVAVATLLCLEGDPNRGLTLLTAVQTERSSFRHESWARNWGDVRALIVPCADRAGTAPPPLPDRNDAGAGDQLEARAVLRLRTVSKRDPGDGPALRTAAFDVIQLLKGGPLPAGARVRVLAALLASGHSIDETLAAALATPHPDEGPLLPASRSLTAIDWLAEPRGLRPLPSRHALRHAADRLERLARSPELSREERASLEKAAAATVIEAARAFALAGDAPAAIEILDRAGARLIPSAAARALYRSTAWYVAADPGRALAEVEHEPADLQSDLVLQASWWIQKAELFAGSARPEEAARASTLADEAARRAGDRGLEVRALWTRLAFARGRSPLLPADPPRPVPGKRRWPWTGEIGTAASWLSPDAEGWPDEGGDAGKTQAPAVPLAQALAFWDAAREAPPEERRAIRYAAVSADRGDAHRGDAPRARTAYLALGAQLLGEGEGDVEVWLDAFSASWARKMTMRAYAWARAEAARFRGDAEAASQWTHRYRTLAEMAAAPDDAELMAVLGL